MEKVASIVIQLKVDIFKEIRAQIIRTILQSAHVLPCQSRGFLAAVQLATAKIPLS